MEAVGTVLVFVGLVGLVIGIVNVIRPIRRMHVASRRIAGLILVAGLAVLLVGDLFLFLFGTDTAPGQTSASVSAPYAPTGIATPTGPTATPDIGATQTAQAGAVAATRAAQAAAAARLEQFKTSPPDGTYSQAGRSGTVVISQVKYETSLGPYRANSGSKYVVVGATFNAATSGFVSSNDFTLVGIDGRTVSPDVSTFGFNPYFPTLSVLPGNRAFGALSFFVPRDFIPSMVVWHGFSETITVIMVLP